MVKVNADLEKERRQCTFKVEELTNIIDGGLEKTLARRERAALAEKIMLEEDKAFDRVPEEYQGCKERYENGIKRSSYIFKTIHQWREKQKYKMEDYKEVLLGILNSSIVRDGSPYGLHYMMFIPAIIHLGNDEQRDKWLPRAWKCNIIGSFAQTELGHGTFVRGVETTATYDALTQEFVLNTPSLTARKWWPGALGQTANYSIVVAQLYTKGENRGIHPFMLQVRDEDTHMPLPGITLGEVGAKMGLNIVNNGFMVLDNVRIPRSHMMMKHAQVLEDGTFVQSKNSKLNYGAMLFVRVLIVSDCGNHLSRAATIATRYAAVRRQCPQKINEPEVQIIDYKTQQHKIFIAISTCYALRFNASKLWDTYNSALTEFESGNFERLSELHALACCLKATSTTDTTALVERCLFACGGFGYMQSSNLPFLFGTVAAACIYEGDRTILLLQTARFLLKTWQQVDSVKMMPTVAYLKTFDSYKDMKWQNSVEGILTAFQIVAARKIASCSDNMSAKVMAGAPIEVAWNENSVELTNAAEAHSRVVLLSTYNEDIKRISATVSLELKAVLNQLLELYAVYWALERLADLLRYTHISEADIVGLQTWYGELLAQIRVNAVGLVDAFDLRDEMLQSTLGAYDGRVYERLMEEALKSPLNQELVNQSFHQYLKPFMQGKL